MASLGDNILRLFKKMAKQQDQHANADQVTQLDGSNEARLKQLSDRSAMAADVNVQDSEFMSEPQMPTRGKEFLQGNFGMGPRELRKKSAFDFKDVIYYNDDVEGTTESLRAVSFNKVISHRRLDEMDEFKAAASHEDVESPLDEPGSASLFVGKLLGEENTVNKAATWSTTPLDALAPGKSVNPTEESFKQVAICPTTSPSTLSWLATQPSAEIRAAVASNHHVPQDTLRKLSADADVSVRLAVASNKRTADDILKQLTHDDNRLVSGEAFSALALREKANAQTSGPAFNTFARPKVNPVQTKVPIIGSGTSTKTTLPAVPAAPSNKPPLPAPQFSKSASLPLPKPLIPMPVPSAELAQAAADSGTAPLAAPTSPSPSTPLASSPSTPLASSPSTPLASSPSTPPASSPSTPLASSPSTPFASSPSSSPTSNAASNAPSDLPSNSPKTTTLGVSPKMVTPRSLPKSTVTSPPPSGLPPSPAASAAKTNANAASTKTAFQSLPVEKTQKPAPAPAPASAPSLPPPSPALASSQSAAAAPGSSIDARPISGEINVDPAADAGAAPDGHNLLSNHKFKTTSNHLVASYTDLDAISLELDNRSPNTWLSLNSEGAIKAYKKQKDTVKDVKMNLGAHNPNGPKRSTPQVNITPNATASETIAFLKIVAGRISTPPGRLIELAEHSNEEVRAAVAENVNLPNEGFLHLAKDSVSTVKLRLIDNSNCPTEVLGALQNDSDPYVAFEAKNALKRLGAGMLKEREQSQFRSHGHNSQPGGA